MPNTARDFGQTITDRLEHRLIRTENQLNSPPINHKENTMTGESEKVFDHEAFMKRVEEMLLMDSITDEQKIAILQQLLAIAEKDVETNSNTNAYPDKK